MTSFRFLPELSVAYKSKLFALSICLLIVGSPACAKLWLIPEGIEPTSLESALFVNAPKPTSPHLQEWILTGSILSGDFGKEIKAREELELILTIGARTIRTTCTSNLANYCYLPLTRFNLEDEKSTLRALLSNNSTAVLRRKQEIIQTFRIENQDAIIPERLLFINTQSFKGTLHLLGVTDSCPEQIVANWFGDQKIFAKKLIIRLPSGNRCTFVANKKRQPFMDLTSGKRSKASHSHSADSADFEINKLIMQFLSDRKTVKLRKNEIR